MKRGSRKERRLMLRLPYAFLISGNPSGSSKRPKLPRRRPFCLGALAQAATTLGRARETGKPARGCRARPTSYEEVRRVPDSKARQQCLARRYSGDDARPADCKFPWQPIGRRIRIRPKKTSGPPHLTWHTPQRHYHSRPGLFQFH
jgi:hypothetical protein